MGIDMGSPQKSCGNGMGMEWKFHSHGNPGSDLTSCYAINILNEFYRFVESVYSCLKAIF